MNNIFNNLIIDCDAVGIYYDTDKTDLTFLNNIIQDCSVSCVNDNGLGTDVFYNSIVDDASIPGGTLCHQNTSLVFEDKVGEDFRLHISDIVAYTNNAGSDVSALNNYDVSGDIVDDTWCIGPFHKTPEIAFSVGDNVATDLKTGSPTYSVLNSVITFSVAQTNEFLCAGCVLNRAGLDPYILLKRKISDTKWEVMNSDGTIVADDIGPSPITTITFFTNGINHLVNNPVDSDHITQYLPSDDLVDMDINIKIICANGSTATGFRVHNFTCDRYRHIEVVSPDMSNDDYIESNTNRRHNGAWDTLDHIGDKDNYPNGGGVNYTPHIVYGDSGNENCAELAADWCIIDGLQFSDGIYGINVESCNNPVITNNIIKDCSLDGIHFEHDSADGVEYKESVIAKNIIYKCDSSGIRVDFGREASYDIEANFTTFKINNRETVDIDVHLQFNKYLVELIESAYQAITWSPGKVVINYISGDTMSDVLAYQNAIGSAWGTITALAGALAPMSQTRMENADSYTENASGDQRKNNIKIYHNTIAKCQYGIYIETLQVVNPNTIAWLRNNLVVVCEKDCYYTTFVNPSSIDVSHCASDDISINNFDGIDNVDNLDVRFLNQINNDYRITLNDTTVMYGYHTHADEHYQIDIDMVENWVFGACAWNRHGNEIHFSVGSDTANLDPTPDFRTISIVDSVLTFSPDDIGVKIGVGDRVDYDGPLHCYLAEKMTDYKWYVKDDQGNDVADATDVSVVSVKRVFNSLAAAMSAGVIAEFAYIADQDIDSKALNLFGWYYNDSQLTEEVTINGWTTHPLYRVYLQVPDNTRTQCITNQSHLGVFGGATISSSAVAPASCITITDDNITVKRFSLERADATGDVINSTGSGNIIENNIVRKGENGIVLAGVGAGQLSYSFGNIVYNAAVKGIDLTNAVSINDTVVNCLNGVTLNDANSSATNTISHEDAGTCFNTETGLSYCTSSDATAGIANDNKSLVYINFIDKSAEDFHLKRSDWYAINNGVNSGSGVPFTVASGFISSQPFFFNIDGELISDDTWCRGADTIEDIETIDLYFSASLDTDNFRTLDFGSAGLVTIEDGIATFSVGQTDARVGIGDTIEYTDETGSSVCYLNEKISDTQWHVRTLFGENPDPSLNASLDSIKRTFIDEWLKMFDLNESVSIPVVLGNSDNPLTFLKEARYRINVALYKHSLVNNNISIPEMSTDESHYIRLFTPTDIRLHCNASQSHRGSTKYAGYAGVNTIGSPGVEVFSSYTIVDGLVITSLGSHCVSLRGVHGCVVINNIFHTSDNGIYYDGGSYQNIHINNTIYSMAQNGINLSGSDIAYNNTVDFCGNYGYEHTAGDTLINNIGQRCTTKCFKDPRVTNCVSDDSFLFNYNGNINETVIDFVAAIGEEDDVDYHLEKENNTVLCSGKKLDGNIHYKFSTDGSGTPRSTWWDPGSLEYQTKHVVYSVGEFGGDLQTKNGTDPAGYIISVQNDISFITFNVPQVNESLGIGDKIVDTKNLTDGCVLKEKITTSKWIVTDFRGNYFTESISGNCTEILRCFPTLKVACDSSTGFRISTYLDSFRLTNIRTGVTLACYDDNDDNEPYSGAYLSGLFTGPHTSVKIMAPNNTVTQCNKSQRHDGIYGYDGFRTELTFLEGSIDAAIHAFGIYYLEIEGIQIKAINRSAHGIHLEQCESFYIGYNIVTECGLNGIFCKYNGNKNIIVNNLVYDCGDDGIGLEFAYVSNPQDAVVNNNTIVDCRRGIYLNKENVYYDLGLSVTLTNNICQDSEYRDYVAEFENYFSNFSLNKCISSDETADNFAGAYNIKNQEIEFISRGTGNYNLKAPSDGVAINNGVTLSYDTTFPFPDDIAGVERDADEFDIGAFEVVAIIGSGDTIVGPTAIQSNVGVVVTVTPVLVLHLREDLTDNLLPNVDPDYQFDSIASLNAFVDEIESFYDITVYVQAGIRFDGTFSFNTRAERTVIVETYPPELKNYGPSSIRYTSNLADDESLQLLLKFVNIKVYSVDGGSYSLLSSGSSAQGVRFENCIVQVNNDCISEGPFSTVQSINSILIFKNLVDKAILCLRDTVTSVGEFQVENLVANSMILCKSNRNMVFVIQKMIILS